MQTHSTHKILLALLFGAVLISFSGVWVKLAAVPATTSAFYRVAIGGVFLLLYSVWRGELWRVRVGQLLWGVLAGAVFAIDLWLYHASVVRVGPGLGTILPNFQVFLLAGFGFVFFKEPVRVLYLIAVPCAIAGLFMLVGVDWNEHGPEYSKGVIYGLSAAMAYAAFLLALRRMQSRDASISFFTNLGVVSAVSAIILAAPLVGVDNGFAAPSVQAVVSLLALGVLSQVVGWNIITVSLPKLNAGTAGAILLLQPALAFVWDVLFFHRPSSFSNWAGLFVVLASVYAATFQPESDAARRLFKRVKE